MYVHHYVHYMGIPYNYMYMYINSISGSQDIHVSELHEGFPTIQRLVWYLKRIY